MDETVLELVRAHMKDVNVATAYDKVYKDECMFCFATSESPSGLYINLKTFQAFDEEHVDLDQERTGTVLYLHEQARRVQLSEEEQTKIQDKPDKLAIGGEGGFQVDAKKYKIEKEYALVLMPARLRVELPCPELPELVLSAITAVQAHDSANVEANVAAWQEERAVSKYADGLEQLPAQRTIPMDPKRWKCDETGVTENLWLNLSTGFIGSGRPQWDGSGGNGSALRHYEATGKKYPLSVKLGTITPHGADVFSYAEDENDMVLDPHLAKHLAHWGINMLQMEKTEKTMAELQIDLNLAAEFDRITEAGAKLQPLHGPGYVGLKNLGNSCYMNSVLQLLWTLPLLRQRYVDAATQLFKTAPADAAGDFASQFAKVGAALVEGKTGHNAGPDPMAYEAVTVSTEGGLEGVAEGVGPDDWSVSPAAFKALVGRGHPEFSSMRQQDAEEYWGHLLEVMARTERAAGGRLPGAEHDPTPSLFKFSLEDRIQCLESGRVAYRRGGSTVLGLEIPLEAATNSAELRSYKQRESEREQKRQKLLDEGAAADAIPKEDGEERVIPSVPFSACLDRLAADSLVEDYHSAALGRKTQASKRVRFGSFPPYLLVQMRRYYVAPDWTPKKMEVLVEVPERLDLEPLRAKGPQPDEQLQPEEEAAQPAAAAAAAAAPAAPEPDDTIVAQLVSMGFSENGSKRAALAVSNSGAEQAMEWVFVHMADADFNDPLPPPGQQPAAGAGAAAPEVSAEALSMLTTMGFSDRQATAALTACQGSVERAGDWLFSHMDDMDSAVEAVLSGATAAGGGGGTAAAGGAEGAAAAGTGVKVLDGRGEYELVGFISHMGSNTACGHYVCHIKKEGRWVIYNDEKVAVSEKPPRDLGYLYLFKRTDMA